MKLHLLRHGVSTRRKIGIWGRLFDAPLDPAFLRKMESSRSELRDVDAQVFTSPMKRCVQSLAYVNTTWNPTKIEEFRAYDSGSFEAVTEDFIRVNFPEYLVRSYAERFISPQFGEESVSEQVARVRAGFIKMLQMARKDNVVVCAHFSVINIIANLAAGNRDLLGNASGLFEVDEGGLLIIDIDPIDLLWKLDRNE